MPTILNDPGVIDDPRHNADLRRHPLDRRPHQQRGVPGRVSEKLLQRFVPGRRLLEPKQGRLQTLAPTLLDQPAHIQKRVLTLPHMRQRPHHLIDKREQPLPRRTRRHHDHRSFHPSPPPTMTTNADTVRRQNSGPFSELTKSY